jgi:rRNA maturation endonuclease Nob1
MRTPFNWIIVCRACGRKFYSIDMNGYLCIDCLYELHAKEDRNA